ncbi:DUF2007 domain-containing protein [Clostridium sp. YIM B02515]|uniref:DUF2007 domain-containing protein n=1 Tax=Clostridium rhizosphaerae TaxID=2803861 RepID=A0ABS1TDC6_9CLOT|nr:DUF2007 domain-containing protein [Clostridium rhizosphaerae]MBL4937366.1 DUF2007 domain-containing protein [Clostridium rhizosphaerae]
MFCPKCRGEYVEGIKVCPECGEKLIDELNEEDGVEYRPMVTVLKTFDRGVIAIAKSLLQSEYIPFYVSGELTFGIITFTTINPMELQVPEEYEEKAKEILADFIE